MRYFILLIISITTAVNAQTPRILPMEKRAQIIDEILEERIREVLPRVMRDNDLDMWLLISREYNEDPVIKTFLPATWLSARRRTMLLIYDPGEGKELETLAVARYDVGKMFLQSWDKDVQPDQWARLAELISERDPAKIGVNFSDAYGHADGIAATDLRLLKESLPEKYSDRIVSAEKVAVGWLETRSERELMIYGQICRIAHDIILEAFSPEVVSPGITSTDDVVWWLRDRVRELGLTTWFHPTVSVQRADPESFDHLRSFSSRPEQQLIMPGDLLHVDFGITYLRLNTDTQQHAYVLRPDETDAPDYLKEALARGNRLQDIFTGNFSKGKTGNEILKQSRDQAISEDIKPSIYSHPIGFHGHAAGTTLGMWDAQEGVPYTGDYPLHYNTAYAIELNAATFIEEWDKEIRIMLEEDAVFLPEGVRYIDGRQTELILIR
ncbi:MAG: M24 family metallopeptidase [Cyclobacteriaceae bacterium]